jgi:hypothetical protein
VRRCTVKRRQTLKIVLIFFLFVEAPAAFFFPSANEKKKF